MSLLVQKRLAEYGMGGVEQTAISVEVPELVRPDIKTVMASTLHVFENATADPVEFTLYLRLMFNGAESGVFQHLLNTSMILGTDGTEYNYGSVVLRPAYIFQEANVGGELRAAFLELEMFAGTGDLDDFESFVTLVAH